MKKPVIMIVIGGLILGIIGAGGYLYFSKNTGTAAEITPVVTTPTSARTLLTWDDPSGFTMQYPDDVTVNKHEEDTQNYAHVELTSATHPGGVTVWVKDLPKGVTNTASWGKMAATPSSAISFDTTLGGQPAQKILISGTPKTASVGIVYDGVVWSVEVVLTDEAYWQSVHDAITQSFAFKPIATANQAPASDGGDTSVNNASVDEEEVLE